jgi:hypothetical protein
VRQSSGLFASYALRLLDILLVVLMFYAIASGLADDGGLVDPQHPGDLVTGE